MTVISAEQKARDMLQRLGVADAQSFTAGDLVELANLIHDEAWFRSAITKLSGVWQVKADAAVDVHDPSRSEGEILAKKDFMAGEMP